MSLFRQWSMGNCFYCQKPTYRMGQNNEHPQKYTRDHLIPARLRGGIKAIGYQKDWTVTCCNLCNKRKGSQSPQQFLKRFPKEHRREVFKAISRAYGLLGKLKAEAAKNLAAQMAQKLQQHNKVAEISGA